MAIRCELWTFLFLYIYSYIFKYGKWYISSRYYLRFIFNINRNLLTISMEWEKFGDERETISKSRLVDCMKLSKISKMTDNDNKGSMSPCLYTSIHIWHASYFFSIFWWSFGGRNKCNHAMWCNFDWIIIVMSIYCSPHTFYTFRRPRMRHVSCQFGLTAVLW